MSHVGNLWERLIRAVLQMETTRSDAYSRRTGGDDGNVPSSHSNGRDIELILRAADEIQDEDLNIARILCEDAYDLALNLDPNSKGRGVLQFKTGLMSVIKNKLARKEGGGFDRSQDTTRLRDFYKLYREKNNIDHKLQEEEMEPRESGTFGGNLQELEQKAVKSKRVFATLKVLETVLEHLTKKISPQVAEELIPEELERVIESDAAMTQERIAYNTIPLDAPAMTNTITSSPKNLLKSSIGRTSFTEHQMFSYIYHSFHGLWIFLFMMFQALAIIAFNDGNLDSKTIREVLSLGPTYFVMKFFQSAFDMVRMYGAYSTTRRSAVLRIFIRFIWFGITTVFICFLYVKSLKEKARSNSESIVFKIYIITLGIYASSEFFWSSLAWLPWGRRLLYRCETWSVVRFIMWVHQEQYHVGHGIYESTSDFIMYILFWLIVLGSKFSFSYFLQIRPLVKTTRDVSDIKDGHYSWHDFISKNNHDNLTIACLWAPVFCIYLLDIQVFYTIVSAAVGFLIGVRDVLVRLSSSFLHEAAETEEFNVPLSTPSNAASASSVPHEAETSSKKRKRKTGFGEDVVKLIENGLNSVSEEMGKLVEVVGTPGLQSMPSELSQMGFDEDQSVALSMYFADNPIQLRLWTGMDAAYKPSFVKAVLKKLGM